MNIAMTVAAHTETTDLLADNYHDKYVTVLLLDCKGRNCYG
jgi:hypothetical protein